MGAIHKSQKVSSGNGKGNPSEFNYCSVIVQWPAKFIFLIACRFKNHRQPKKIAEGLTITHLEGVVKNKNSRENFLSPFVVAEGG